MTDIAQTFSRLQDNHEAALIGYVAVGHPRTKDTPRIVAALVQGGCDIIELGIPFSDPIADGPIIQRAVSRALANGTRPLDALEVARKIRQKYATPMVLMTYFNPVFRLGVRSFVVQARRAGISGMIVPDLPIEEGREYKKICDAEGIDTIFLASPSTSPDRLKQISVQTSGYLYLISLYGVTGIRRSISPEALKLIRTYRGLLSADIPLAAGFGISKPDHVKDIVEAGANGAIVGSAFVKIIEENRRNITQAAAILRRFARSMKRATAVTR